MIQLHGKIKWRMGHRVTKVIKNRKKLIKINPFHLLLKMGLFVDKVDRDLLSVKLPNKHSHSQHIIKRKVSIILKVLLRIDSIKEFLMPKLLWMLSLRGLYLRNHEGNRLSSLQKVITRAEVVLQFRKSFSLMSNLKMRLLINTLEISLQVQVTALLQRDMKMLMYKILTIQPSSTRKIEIL